MVVLGVENHPFFLLALHQDIAQLFESVHDFIFSDILIFKFGLGVNDLKVGGTFVVLHEGLDLGLVMLVAFKVQTVFLCDIVSHNMNVVRS